MNYHIKQDDKHIEENDKVSTKYPKDPEPDNSSETVTIDYLVKPEDLFNQLEVKIKLWTPCFQKWEVGAWCLLLSKKRGTNDCNDELSQEKTSYK